MKHLDIGHNLSLPIDAATQTFAFIGRKRSGKTYAAGRLVELLLEAKVQVIVVDTVGNWYGLRLSRTGKSPSHFDVPIFGGLRGDVALNPQAGELVADTLMDTGRSAIVDVSQFTGADRKRFITAMGERLWQRKKAETHPTPVHLVIEECQLVIPQFVGQDETRMVGIFEQIVRLGGNYGIGVSMITQRPQSVNKEALTQTECIFAFQVNGVPEKKALKEWMTHEGGDVSLVDELPSLPVGTAFVWSPQWLNIFQKVKVSHKETFDASSTPKVGEVHERRDPAPLNLQDLESRMASLVEEAKANDPKELRKEIAHLKKQLSELPSEPRTVEIEKIVEVSVLKNGQLERTEKIAARVEALAEKFTAEVSELRRLITPAASPRPAAKPVHAPAPAPVPHARPRIEHQPKVMPRDVDDGAMSIGVRRMLTALAQRNGLSGRQLGIRSGYSVRSSTFRNYLSKARVHGWIEGTRDLLTITNAGLAALGDFTPLPTGRELLRHWLNELGGGPRAMLRQLADAYPDSLSGEELGARSGFSSESSTFRNYLSKLRTLELIEGHRSALRASSELFD